MLTNSSDVQIKKVRPLNIRNLCNAPACSAGILCWMMLCAWYL